MCRQDCAELQTTWSWAVDDVRSWPRVPRQPYPAAHRAGVVVEQQAEDEVAASDEQEVGRELRP
jgi:hypothetical protein